MDDEMIAYIGELMDTEVCRLNGEVCCATDSSNEKDAINKLAWAETMADAWHSIKWVPAD